MECLSFDSRAYKYKNNEIKGEGGAGQKFEDYTIDNAVLFLPYRYMYQLPEYNKNMQRLYM